MSVSTYSYEDNNTNLEMICIASILLVASFSSMLIINHGFETQQYQQQQQHQYQQQQQQQQQEHDRLVEENNFLIKMIDEIFTEVATKKIDSEILESSVSTLSSNKTMTSNEELDTMILSLLTSMADGLAAKNVLKKLIEENEDLDKSRINSRLYKMLGAKKVKKTTDKCPIWQKV